VRINAEDPAGGRFVPSPGPITALRPAQGIGVRWDGGYESGDEVSQFYDNLVGKLIVWAGDRPAAIARTIRALEEMRIEGIATTIPADLAILGHPDFAEARHSTKWVEERLDLSEVRARPSPDTVAATAAATAEGTAERKLRRDVDVEVNGRKFSVAVWLPESQLAAAADPGTTARVGSRRRRAASRSGGGGGSGDVTVPMQGTIVKVLVAVGEAVEVGQTVCVLEAMKMENNITAERAGTIKEIRVEPGQSVGSGDVIAVIE
jgi:acetyl-CoA/propionyl-CoA carboxylase biotin carboxyl carrier protein